MTRAPRLVAVAPWVILVGATLAAFLLAEEGVEASLATTIVLLITAFKIRLLVGHFMEVGWTARPWRLALDLWIATVTLIVLGGYWVSLG